MRPTLPTMNKSQNPEDPVPVTAPAEPNLPQSGVSVTTEGSDLGAWLRRPSSRVVLAPLLAVLLLGGGVFIGHVATPQGPATLTAAITKAAAGEFPCGNTSTLPGALKTVCGAPTAQPAVNPKTKRAAVAGLGALRSVFGPGVLFGRIGSVTATQLTLGAAKKHLLLEITASTECLKVARSSGAVTTTPVPISALHPGLLVIVAPAAGAAVGSVRTALYIYLLGAAAVGAVA